MKGRWFKSLSFLEAACGKCSISKRNLSTLQAQISLYFAFLLCGCKANVFYQQKKKRRIKKRACRCLSLFQSVPSLATFFLGINKILINFYECVYVFQNEISSYTGKSNPKTNWPKRGRKDVCLCVSVFADCSNKKNKTTSTETD